MSRTITQTRDARSPLLPPIASQTILEVEQKNRDPGLRTTGLTLEEIESAGVGRVFCP